MLENESIRLEISSEDAITQLRGLKKIANRDDVRGLTLAVIQAVASDHSEVRAWAVEAIQRSIKPSPDEATQLCELLGSTTHSLQVECIARTLGTIGTDCKNPAVAAESLHAAFQRIDHGQTTTRERLVWALAQFGSAAQVASQSLKQTAQNSSPRLQRLATEALRRLDAA